MNSMNQQVNEDYIRKSKRAKHVDEYLKLGNYSKVGITFQILIFDSIRIVKDCEL